MNAVPSGPTALIVERHAFVAAYLRAVLERAGHVAVTSSRSGSAVTLRRLQPDTIVIDGGSCGRRPLASIRRARLERPKARIIAIADRDDAAWRALARAVGADVVLGPDAGGTVLQDLFTTYKHLQENGATCRTAHIGISPAKRPPS